MPAVKYIDGAANNGGWSSVDVMVDGVQRTIQWPPGVRRTEEHLGKHFHTDFGTGVYKDLWREIQDGMIASSERQRVELVADGVKREADLFFLTERGGVWWALKSVDARPRIMGCGFLAAEGTKLIVQSAMLWKKRDRQHGFYPVVLQRLREWARPGTVYSDVCMSAQAVMSWNQSVKRGVATFDEKEGRYRRNPRRVKIVRFVRRVKRVR